MATINDPLWTFAVIGDATPKVQPREDVMVDARGRMSMIENETRAKYSTRVGSGCRDMAYL